MQEPCQKIHRRWENRSQDGETKAFPLMPGESLVAHGYRVALESVRLAMDVSFIQTPFGRLCSGGTVLYGAFIRSDPPGGPIPGERRAWHDSCINEREVSNGHTPVRPR